MKEPFKFTEEQRLEVKKTLHEIFTDPDWGFKFFDAEAVNRIEQLIQSMDESLPSHPEPANAEEVLKDISISDFRKVFAHRASRILNDLNVGANQLMTLTDFKLAIQDMGWRIGFDKIASLEYDLAAAKSHITDLEQEVKMLKERCELKFPKRKHTNSDSDIDFAVVAGWNDCIRETKRLNSIEP